MSIHHYESGIPVDKDGVPVGFDLESNGKDFYIAPSAVGNPYYSYGALSALHTVGVHMYLLEKSGVITSVQSSAIIKQLVEISDKIPTVYEENN